MPSVQRENIKMLATVFIWAGGKWRLYIFHLKTYQKHCSSAQLVYLIKKHVTNKSILACFDSSMSLREFCWAVSTPYQGYSCRQPCIVMVLFPIPLESACFCATVWLSTRWLYNVEPCAQVFPQPHLFPLCLRASSWSHSLLLRSVRRYGKYGWNGSNLNNLIPEWKNTAGVILTFTWTQENSTYYISPTVDLIFTFIVWY